VASSPPTHPDFPRSEEEDQDTEVIAEPFEFLVTLQLPADKMQQYINASKQSDIDLLRICDLPCIPTNIRLAKDIAKHAMDTNSKLCFVGWLLELLKASQNKVLIVVRNEELVKYLGYILDTSEIAYSQTGLDDAQATDVTKCGLAVILALADHPVQNLGTFDLVIAYDTSYLSSEVVKSLQMNDEYPADITRPVILTLVNTYTIEHFDVTITKHIDPSERSARLESLCRMKEFTSDSLSVDAKTTAKVFAEHILHREWLATLLDEWVPHQIPVDQAQEDR
jgi:hypothetical protein